MNFEFTMNMSDYYLMNKLSIASFINALLAMVLFITFLINYLFVSRTRLVRLLGKFALILFFMTFSFAMFTNGKNITAIFFWHKISLMKSSLTGVYTRRYFEENYDKYIITLSEEERKKNKHWIAFIDIDKFKKVNDKYGHTEILKELGKILIDKSGGKDLPARFGGDEFMYTAKESGGGKFSFYKEKK